MSGLCVSVSDPLHEDHFNLSLVFSIQSIPALALISFGQFSTNSSQNVCNVGAELSVGVIYITRQPFSRRANSLSVIREGFLPVSQSIMRSASQ